MRVAVLGDIHGNSIALDRVLEDIHASGGVDEYWVMGDLAAIGPDPVGALELAASLPRARFIRGNTDRYLITGEIPGFDPSADGENLPGLRFLLHLARSFAWTAGAVSAAGWLPWFKELPLEMRAQLSDGSRILAVHAAPGMDDGPGIHPGVSEADLADQLTGTEADLILVGHTHTPFEREIGAVKVVNPGSVSNPFPPDLRASYVLLSSDRDGYSLAFRRVDYDREAVVAMAEEVNHPAAAYITQLMRGERRPPWEGEA
jgi:putative phosphoesterase